MGIKLLRQAGAGQALPPTDELLSDGAVGKEAARRAERVRLDNAKKTIRSRFGRGRVRMRRGRLRKMKTKNKKRKYIFGAHYLYESGYLNGGHRTFYYHATKGWRRRLTSAQGWLMGNTVTNRLLLRFDMIEAHKAGDKERVKEVQKAFKRTNDAACP